MSENKEQKRFSLKVADTLMWMTIGLVSIGLSATIVAGNPSLILLSPNGVITVVLFLVGVAVSIVGWNKWGRLKKEIESAP